MTASEIITKVKSLNLPNNSFVVFGSCPLALAGIREAGDVDMLVSPEVYSDLQRQGWQEVVKGPDDTPLTRDVFEAHEHWNFSQYKPTLEQLLATATVVEGVPFAALSEVRAWKAASGRPKDLADIKAIDAYLAGTAA